MKLSYIRTLLAQVFAAIAARLGLGGSGTTPTTDPHRPSNPGTDTYRVVVTEADGGDIGVDSGIDLRRDDHVSLLGSGSIWAGVWLTDDNGPDGWENIENSPDFPLPGSRPFGLLYKIVERGQRAGRVSWEVLGYGDSFDWSGDDARLWFTINDDVPGNGSGQFNVDVSVRHAT